VEIFLKKSNKSKNIIIAVEEKATAKKTFVVLSITSPF